MNEVKGGIVIEQLKGYAKRLSENANASARVRIELWCHLYQGKRSYDFSMDATHSDMPDFIKPRFESEDLRDLGKAIDDYIEGNLK